MSASLRYECSVLNVDMVTSPVLCFGHDLFMYYILSHYVLLSRTITTTTTPQVGGTVGDIESMVFLEALRQFQFTAGKENFFLVHVSLVPVLGSVGEQKTKPTQHSVKVRTAVCALFCLVLLCHSPL